MGKRSLSPDDLAQVLELSPEGLAVVGGERYLYANASWARQLGRTPSELIGRPLLEQVNADDQDRVAGLLQAHASSPLEAGFLKADGTLVFLELRLFGPLERPEGQAHALIGRDVTRLKQAQARLLLADRMMSIGALAAGVAHEINNPLSYVLGNLSFLLEEVPARLEKGSELERDVLEALNEAQEGAERVRRIVRDLQAFSRADQEKTAPISVNRVVESAVNMAWIEIRHRARLIKDLGELPAVTANEARLGQVILNLLLHAAHSLPEGKADQHQIRIRTAVDGAMVAIEVSDNGPGLSEDQKRHLFDALPHTAHDLGLGIGLSIAQSIVLDLGGAIMVEGRPGQGSLFRVLLPTEQGRDKNETGPLPTLATSGRKLKILVVDDEPLIATALRRALKGEDVEVVDSGKRAIEALENGEFDVIFCDLMMPELTGMDVYDWVAKNRVGHESRIVLMSGGTFTPRAQAFLETVKNPRIEKPFELERVRRLVQRLK